MIKITDYYGLGSDKPILEAAMRGLGVDDVEIIVTRNDGLLQRFINESWVVNALLHKAPPPLKCFNLYISSEPQKAMPLLLCHEAVHMSQYMRGDLALNLEKKEFTWKGKKFDNSCDYLSRPWEIEAFAEESKVLRAAKKEVSRPKCNLLSWFKNGKKK